MLEFSLSFLFDFLQFFLLSLEPVNRASQLCNPDAGDGRELTLSVSSSPQPPGLLSQVPSRFLARQCYSLPSLPPLPPSM
jgi:hypothetical protein